MQPVIYVAQMRAHRKNIIRYRTILNSHLTPLESAFVKRRIVEEERAIVAMAGHGAPSFSHREEEGTKSGRPLMSQTSDER